MRSIWLRLVRMRSTKLEPFRDLVARGGKGDGCGVVVDRQVVHSVCSVCTSASRAHGRGVVEGHTRPMRQAVSVRYATAGLETNRHASMSGCRSGSLRGAWPWNLATCWCSRTSPATSTGCREGASRPATCRGGAARELRREEYDLKVQVGPLCTTFESLFEERRYDASSGRPDSPHVGPADGRSAPAPRA